MILNGIFKKTTAMGYAKAQATKNSLSVLLYSES